MPFMERLNVIQLLLLLCRSRTGHFDSRWDVAERKRLRIDERVQHRRSEDPPNVSCVRNIKRLFLNPAALVLRLHRAQNAAAFVDAQKFVEHGFFYDVRQPFNKIGSLHGIFILRHPKFFVDDELNRLRPANGLFCWRRDRFVIRVGVERIAIVGNCNQSLPEESCEYR